MFVKALYPPVSLSYMGVLQGFCAVVSQKKYVEELTSMLLYDLNGCYRVNSSEITFLSDDKFSYRLLLHIEHVCIHNRLDEKHFLKRPYTRLRGQIERPERVPEDSSDLCLYRPQLLGERKGSRPDSCCALEALCRRSIIRI